MAKERARVGPAWVLPDTDKLCPVLKVIPRTPDTPYLTALQCQYLSLKKLVQKTLFGISVYGNLARQGEEPLVWVVPEMVCTDHIVLAREQGHLGIDQTIERMVDFSEK